MPVDEITEVEVTDAGAEQAATARPDATNGVAGGGDALALMLEGLRETNPSAAAEKDAAVAESEAPPASPDKPATVSRRAKTVEREVGKVLTEAEQKIADAETARTAAETRAAELEAELTTIKAAPTAEAEQARITALEQEYGGWIGTKEQYAEATRWSRMDNTDPEWDFDRHQREVANLNTFDERRKWAGTVRQTSQVAGEEAGRTAVLAEFSKDFIDTLAADLPEDKREAYRTHKEGIPGAVRYYAETVYAPQLEAKDAIIAERDAEIERLRTTGGDRRGLGMGGAGTSGPPAIDYQRASPEEIMAQGLREQAQTAGRRR